MKSRVGEDLPPYPNPLSYRIKFNPHARYSMKRRGAQEREIKEAIKRSHWIPARKKRLECEWEFTFQRKWNGKFYKKKKVRPVFVKENNQIIVITVYVYYY